MIDYSKWIEAYVARYNGFVRGKCAEATLDMVQAFPDLRRACGFVYTEWGRDQHWWCVSPDGHIVDPTKSQFPWVSDYEELDLNNPEDRARVPTGVCPNCGDETYNGDTMCGESCERSYLAYLNGLIG